MERIRLKFRGLSEIVGTEKMGLIVLTDEAEIRQVTIVCDRHVEHEFSMRMADTPITNKMLPEALWKMLKQAVGEHFDIVINGIYDGQYSAALVNTDTAYTVQMRASDAVLLSCISGLPLFMERSLMMRQSVPFHAGAQGLSIPVNAISDDMLKSAMEKAINDENYELASQLRDEQKRRMKKRSSENEERQ